MVLENISAVNTSIKVIVNIQNSHNYYSSNYSKKLSVKFFFIQITFENLTTYYKCRKTFTTFS